MSVLNPEKHDPMRPASRRTPRYSDGEEWWPGVQPFVTASWRPEADIINDCNTDTNALGEGYARLALGWALSQNIVEHDFGFDADTALYHSNWRLAGG